MKKTAFKCYGCNLECELSVYGDLEGLPDQCPITEGDENIQPNWEKID